MGSDSRKGNVFSDKRWVTVYDNFFRDHLPRLSAGEGLMFVEMLYRVGTQGRDTGVWFGTAAALENSWAGLSGQQARRLLRAMQVRGYWQFEARTGGKGYPVFFNKYRLRYGKLEGYELNAKASLRIGRLVYDWPKGGASGIALSLDGGASYSHFVAESVPTGRVLTLADYPLDEDKPFITGNRTPVMADGSRSGTSVTHDGSLVAHDGASVPGGGSMMKGTPSGDGSSVPRDERKVRNIGEQRNRSESTERTEKAKRVIVSEIRNTGLFLGRPSHSLLVKAYGDFLHRIGVSNPFNPEDDQVGGLWDDDDVTSIPADEDEGDPHNLSIDAYDPPIISDEDDQDDDLSFNRLRKGT